MSPSARPKKVSAKKVSDTAVSDTTPRAGARLIYLMGPSGSGKDTLLRLLAAALQDGEPVRVARRCITRASGADEASVEVSDTGFERIAAAGGFALQWRSHGLRYGIGVEIDGWLAQGAVVLVNGSRRHLAAARARYPALTAVEVVVAPAVLADRLARRGRETPAQIAERLAAVMLPAGECAGVVRLDNNTDPEVAARVLLALARRLLAGPA